MLRMDLLLNPCDSPPPRTAVVPEQHVRVLDAKKLFRLADAKDAAAASAVQIDNQVINEQRLTLNAVSIRDLCHSPEPKRLKRIAPSTSVDAAVADNQRDDVDDANGIFGDQDFWGRVPSLNLSPSDVARPSFFVARPSVKIAPAVDTTVDATVDADATSPDRADGGVRSFQKLTVESTSSSTSASPTPNAELTNNEATETDGARKKKVTICKEDGCKSQALSKQLCMRHGGGPRCSFAGCNNGAKLKNLCFQHGGSTLCLTTGCSSKAKRFGYCWSHGGGRICSEEGCDKVAAQGGMCWAHGGGNRCKLAGCSKRSYKQHNYYCKRHADVFADY